MTTSQPNQGGMKHYRSKTKKLNHYRRVLRTLKSKNYKTKSAKLRKQHRIKYIKDRIKKLNTRRRNPKTLRKRVREEPVDHYISPRVVPIAATGISTVSPISQPPASISPITFSPSHIVETTSPTNIPMSIQSPISSTAQTDSSIASSIVPPPPLPQAPIATELPSVNIQESPMGNSLHLSDLAVPSPTTIPNSIESANTTKESMSM